MTQEERFTEVFSHRTHSGKVQRSSGSGFLLGGGVIITARHVIAPDEWDGGCVDVSELTISARSIGHARISPKPRAAELAWPSDLRARGPDVALLKLVGNSADNDPDDAPLIGLDDVGENLDEGYPAIKVFAVGFPRFARMDGSSPERKRADSHAIVGQIKPYTAILSETFQIDELVLGSRQGSLATPNDGWQGFSGAPLIAQRTLIGVVTTANTNGIFDFRAVRLEPLLKRRDFRVALAGAATLPTQTVKSEKPPLDRFVCLLDRNVQELDFKRIHKRSVIASCEHEPPRLRSIICLLPGAAEYRHAPEELPERFSLKTLPRDLAWPPEISTFTPLTWPGSHLAPIDAAADLQSELWELVSGRGDPPSDPATFREIWDDGTRPRLFLSDLTQHRLTPSMALTLAEWAAFLDRTGPRKQQRPLCHLLLVGATFAETQTWRAQAVPTTAITVGELAELQECNPIDLKPWLKEIRASVSPANAAIVDRLGTTVSAAFPKTFYLKDLRLHVERFLQGSAHE